MDGMEADADTFGRMWRPRSRRRTEPAQCVVAAAATGEGPVPDYARAEFGNTTASRCKPGSRPPATAVPWKRRPPTEGRPKSAPPSRETVRTRSTCRRRQTRWDSGESQADGQQAVRTRRKLSLAVRVGDNVPRPVHHPRSRWGPFISHSNHGERVLSWPTSRSTPLRRRVASNDCGARRFPCCPRRG